MKQKIHILLLFMARQRMMLNKLRKVANENSLKQTAIASAFILQNVICMIRKRFQSEVGSFNGIV